MMNASIMSFTRCALLLLASLVAACTGDVQPLTPAQREVVAAYVSKVAPSPQHALNLDFEGKIKLLGYDLDRERWLPGETMRVTWYWHAIESPGDGWKLFTHIDDVENERSLKQDGKGTLRWLFGPDRWQPGTYIQDPQDLHLPEDWAGSSARLYVGVWRGEERLGMEEGTPDAQGRVLAATVPTPDAAREARVDAEVPTLGVVQTKRPPRLDGSLDDPSWRFANTTRAFVETRNGGVAPIRASAKVLWDLRYLYVGVDVQDALLRASDTEHDDHLWKQDCVELMIDPDGDGKNYFEIQVSPRGAVFDTRYDARRVPQPFGHIDWDSKIRVGVSPRGKLDDEEADAGYTVEIAIPWQAFSLGGAIAASPTIGDEWRANLYVMDLIEDRQQAAAWSSLGTGDFHVPRRFGILAFEGPPQEMLGTSEPLRISADRMPEALEGGRALEGDMKGTMIRRQATKRRHPGRSAPERTRAGDQTLESTEAPH